MPARPDDHSGNSCRLGNVVQGTGPHGQGAQHGGNARHGTLVPLLEAPCSSVTPGAITKSLLYLPFVKTLLVIPCLRERARLPLFLPDLLGALAARGGGVEVMIVDDGSGREEQEWLAAYTCELQGVHPDLLRPLLLAENMGKGGAVYAGWAQAREGHSQLGFVDADGAVPPAEVARLCALVPQDPDQALYAVRTGAEGTRVERHPARAVAGLFFRLLVKVLFRFPIPETQCGCKFVPASAWRAVAAKLTERRFCFDVELTWRLLHQGTSIRTVPVNWQEIPGGQLRAGSVLAMVRSLVNLRGQLGSWRS